MVYRNNAETRANHWLKIRLIGDPNQRTTRDAIGARVVLTTPDGAQVWREIHGGSGYLTMHPKTQHFGLGNATTATAEIYWPDGSVQTVDDLEASQTRVIRQPAAALAEAH